MKNRFVSGDRSNFRSQKRVKDISIVLPKIRAEFYVRLFSLLNHEPEIIEEGYEFFIKDNITGKEFSAGLTGFGPGYFAMEESKEMNELVNEFHKFLFTENVTLKECQIEIHHDFGKTILGYEEGNIIEIDIEE